MGEYFYPGAAVVKCSDSSGDSIASPLIRRHCRTVFRVYLSNPNLIRPEEAETVIEGGAVENLSLFFLSAEKGIFLLGAPRVCGKMRPN